MRSGPGPIVIDSHVAAQSFGYGEPIEIPMAILICNSVGLNGESVISWIVRSYSVTIRASLSMTVDESSEIRPSLIIFRSN